jgi:hypothetical protein
MNGYTLVAIALICLIVVVLAFWFRDRLKLSLKGYGLNFAAEGRNAPSTARIAAIASGERAAVVGGSLDGEILTGDRGKAGRKGVKSTSPPKNSSAQTKSAPSVKPKPLTSGIATASGSRAAVVGGDAKGKITTGDQTSNGHSSPE